MTLLITGATGHVGAALAARAAHCGLSVIGAYRSGSPGNVDGVTWVRCDLRDADAVRALAAGQPISACIHAAAVSNEAYARPDPLAAVATNVGATATLLEAARVHGWRRFILVSTGSVFQHRGDVDSPILESEPVAPGNVYSTTKAAAEMLARMYRTEYGVPAATVRISWVFGPPVISESPARGPIPSFLARVLRGEPIRERGGDFRAAFTWIDDVAEGLITAATAPQLRHDTYHLGHGRNFTAQEVALAVRRAMPAGIIELEPGTEPWTRFTPIRAPLAGTRLQDDTGFIPKWSLDRAIAHYGAWMKRRIPSA